MVSILVPGLGQLLSGRRRAGYLFALAVLIAAQTNPFVWGMAWLMNIADACWGDKAG